MSQKIFSEQTTKLKTKVLIFGGVSLFIGISKVVPTKVSLIGMNLEGKEYFFVWFLFLITLYLLIHFLILAILDMVKFFKKDIVSKKARNFTGDTLGMTYDEIDQEYEIRKEFDSEYYEDKNDGSLNSEAADINRQIKLLEEKFDAIHLSFYNSIEIVTSGFIPFLIGIVGLKYLYCFLLNDLII